MAMKNSGSECEPADYGAFTVVCILCTLEDKLWPLGVDCNTTFKKFFVFFVDDAVFKMFAYYFQYALFYVFISQKFNSAK